MNRTAHQLTFMLAFAIIAFARGAEPITLAGVVTRVKDGDTLVLRSNGRDYTIRLAEIDAPEKRQPGGLAARQQLEAICFGKTVTIDSQGADRYGRTIAHVSVGRVNISERMVQLGHAWRYDAYSKSARLKELQQEAQQAKRGLWAAQEKPIPPWEWRRRDRRR